MKKRFVILPFIIAVVFGAIVFTRCDEDPAENLAQKEADAFISAYADVLALTVRTVKLSDKDRVDDAMSAYNNLSQDAKDLLIPEKAKLNSLVSMINEIELATPPEEKAALFRAAYADVLALNVSAVTLADKARIDKAVTAYNKLDMATQNELGSEKNLLTDLRNKIIALESSSYPASSWKTPKAADEFVDSIGVCIHLGFLDTNYGAWDTNGLSELLVNSGIRHIRDGMPRWNDATTTYLNVDIDAKYRALYRKGIHLTAVMDARKEEGDPNVPNNNLVYSETEIKKMLTESNVYQYISAIEGPNEYNWPYMPYVRPGWDTRLKEFLPRLWNVVRGDTRFSHISIVGPTLVLGWCNSDGQDHSNDSVLLGDVSQWVDYGNVHIYPGRGETISQVVDAEMPKHKVMFGSKPFFVSETGYPTHQGYTGNWHGVTERTQGKNAPRLFLEYFNRGVKRTIFYQFADLYPDKWLDDVEDYFGLVDFHCKPKPSYYAVKNMISILQDPGGAIIPHQISYSISGGNDNVHHTLLEKHNGNIYLILWVDAINFSPSAENPGYEIPVPAQNLTVTLNSVTPSAVKRYTNMAGISGATGTMLGASKTINVAVNDEIVILEITP
jgi:hypothetical protein